MTTPHEYRYVIDAFTPDTLPMARLAEYMRELALLLGEPERVHFERIDRGSAVLISRIDPPAVRTVHERVSGLKDGTAPEDVRKAFRQLDAMLANDNAVGRLTGPLAEPIDFLGRTRPKPIIYGPFNQDGSLDGKLVRIGGRSKEIPVMLDDGNRVYTCTVAKEQAKKLAAHLFDKVRLTGRGRWTRNGEGHWKLHSFRVLSFERLDERPLSDVVKQLRAVPGNGWKNISDPYGELDRLRRDGD